MARGTSVDRYVLLDPVGSGSSGSVYAAYDPLLDRRVALKLMRPAGEGDRASQQGWAAVVREAQALAKLSDPHVVALYDVGVWNASNFLTMELIDGVDLDLWLKQEPRPWSAIVQVLLAAGRGLAAAHRQGVIHRDFKPSNILVASSGQVKVTDFGLARLHYPQGDSQPAEGSRGSATSSGTQTAAPGTPYYMAPELFDGASADIRTDLYAYVVTCYRALYGVYPHDAPTPTDLHLAKRVGFSGVGAGVPRRHLRFFAKGLDPDPRKRFASVDEAMDVLHPRRARRWSVAATAIIALGLGASVPLLVRPSSTCDSGEARIAQIWHVDQRQALGANLLASDRPEAEETVERNLVRLDRWATGWLDARQEVCASRDRGGQTPATFDARMGCLDGQLHHLNAVIRLLEQGGEDLFPRVDGIVAGLPPPDDCAALVPQGALQPPSPPVAALLAEAEANLSAGRPHRAWTVATAAENEAASRDLSGAAEARGLRARAWQGMGERTQAEQGWVETLFAAQKLGHRELQIRASTSLARLLTSDPMGRKEAARWSDYAEVELGRWGVDAPLWPDLWRARAWIAREEGDVQGAIAELEHARQWLESRAPQGEGMATVLSDLSTMMAMAGHLDEAESVGAQGLQMLEAIRGPEHPSLAAALANLAQVYLLREHLPQGIELMSRALAIDEANTGPDSDEVGTDLATMARMYCDMDEHRGAEPLARRALGIFLANHGDTHTANLTGHVVLSSVLRGEGRFDEAEVHDREALRIFEVLDPDSRDRAGIMVNLGNTLMEQGRLEEASQTLQDALDVAQAHEPVEPRLMGNILVSLGAVHGRRGYRAEAREFYRQGLAYEEQAFASDDPHLALVLYGLGMSALELEEPEAAVTHLERARGLLHDTGVMPLLHADIQLALARALAQTGQLERAIALARQAEATFAGAGASWMDEAETARGWLRRHKQAGPAASRAKITVARGG